MGPVIPGVRADTLGPRPGKADYNFDWDEGCRGRDNGEEGVWGHPVSICMARPAAYASRVWGWCGCWIPGAKVHVP